MYGLWDSAEPSRYGSACGTRTQSKTCLDTRFLEVKYLPLTFLSTPGQIVFFKYNLNVQNDRQGLKTLHDRCYRAKIRERVT